MRLIWTGPAQSDLQRLYAFLAPKNEEAAASAVLNLAIASERLLDHPRLGARLSTYETREVRHVIVGDYDLRYEVEDDDILILRVWHGRENR
ncbi:MAG: type II toxin-antitoxin system RelE/ParE family toxin [Rhodospirillaceae bacterium]|nr:type II toxin-antitoxin system RelE/ParE family toxin [Rhodospirillaceae bacterium]